MSAADSPHIKIIQLTDTHLFDSAGGNLLGLDTDHCLDKIIEHIIENENPEFVIATGDLTHNATASAYNRLKTYLSRLNVPVFCLPGNHDESQLLENSLNDGLISAQKNMVTRNDWQIIFLDSTIPGSESGHLAESELDIAAEKLITEKHRPTIICLHHPAVSIDCEWLDTMAIDNGKDLLRLTESHEQVQAIVCGHIHQEFGMQHKHTQLLGTPSTCIQFLPRSKDFALDPIPPGYRRFKLFDNGELETEVVRLDEIPGEISMDKGGY